MLINYEYDPNIYIKLNLEKDRNIKNGFYHYSKVLSNDDILNLELSPINNDIIAVLTPNNSISIFDLSKYAENENQIQPNCILNHTNEISFISFNPVKSNISKNPESGNVPFTKSTFGIPSNI